VTALTDSVDLVLTTYRRALALPGAWQFSASAFVARLPISMTGFGIVLFISTRTGSYALAGILGAAFQVSAAAGSLLTSRWADRVGQHRTLPLLVSVNAVGLLAFVVAVEADLPVVVQGLVVAVAGASQPAIGSMVRARWALAATDPAHLRGGFALESIIDELIFTIGPLLTAFLAIQIALPLPLIVAAGLGVAGGLALSALRATEPPPHTAGSTSADGSTGRRSALLLPGMGYMVIAAVGVGGVFGSYEVAVVAFTQRAGQAGASGLVLGLWAAGSAIGGILFGAQHWRRPLPQQLLILTAALTVVLVPPPFVGSVPVLAATTFVAGVAVAPALIAIFSLTERLVPPALLTEGLTWTNSGMAVGFSIGTSVGGVVIDSVGTTWAFVLPMLSAGSALATVAIGQRTLRAASTDRGQPPPVAAWNDDPLPGPGPGGIVDDPDTEDPSARGGLHDDARQEGE
jgi:predicted MFS family arabinose efflux permease